MIRRQSGGSKLLNGWRATARREPSNNRSADGPSFGHEQIHPSYREERLRRFGKASSDRPSGMRLQSPHWGRNKNCSKSYAKLERIMIVMQHAGFFQEVAMYTLREDGEKLPRRPHHHSNRPMEQITAQAN